MKPAVSGGPWSKVGGKFKSTPDSRYAWMRNGGHVMISDSAYGFKIGDHIGFSDVSLKK